MERLAIVQIQSKAKDTPKAKAVQEYLEHLAGAVVENPIALMRFHKNLKEMVDHVNKVAGDGDEWNVRRILLPDHRVRFAIETSTLRPVAIIEAFQSSKVLTKAALDLLLQEFKNN